MKSHNPQISIPEQIPNCNLVFFRRQNSSKFIQVPCSQSFSKSAQKKLRLIKDGRSLQKLRQLMQQKRKIRPLRLKVSQRKQEQSDRPSVCSIKNYKMKINKITQQSKRTKQQQVKTQETEGENNTLQISREKVLNRLQSFGIQQVNVQQSKTSGKLTTIGSSLVVKDHNFGIQSLLSNIQNGLYRKSQNSGQVSSAQSPTNKVYKQSILLGQNTPSSQYYLETTYQTPVKYHLLDKQLNSNRNLSTQQSNRKSRSKMRSKQKLTLNMARKVETFQTIKTQNDVHYSFIQENQYTKILKKVSYPDYFSPKTVNY